MHKVMEKAEKICELRCTITDWTRSGVEKGMEAACSKELGDAVDMIKDLADAEKNLWKACYYKKVIEAMEDAKKDEEEMEKMLGKMAMNELSDGSDRMGYDNYRYPSSGRYASKGHGSYYGHGRGRMGFVPSPMMMPTTYDDDDMLAQQMWGDAGTRHDGTYDRYSKARRHYTETKSPEDKKKMDESAREHVTGTIETFKEIWKDADPALRAEMKTHLTNLTSQMK